MDILNDEEVGNRLRIKRERMNLSARKFALRADVDVAQYGKIEKGSLPLTDNVWKKIHKTYGFNKDEILFGIIVPHGTSENTEVVNDTASKTGEVNSDVTGLILKSYLSSLAGRHRAMAEEIETILQAMSTGDFPGSDKSKEVLRSVHQKLSDIEGKKGTKDKPEEKGTEKP